MRMDLRRAGAVALLVVLPGVGWAAPAARVAFATAGVVGVDASGVQRPLRKGDVLEQGDSVTTRTGLAQLKFSDGALVSLQPGTVFRIDQYRFAGKADGSERGFFSLLKGGMRTITGLIGRTNRGAYQVAARVATIGIRGTEYQLHQDGGLTGSVGEGEIVVCNGAGCLGVASGQSFFVAEPSRLPVLTAVRTSFAPPQPTPSRPPQEISSDETTQQGVPKDVYDSSLVTSAGDIPLAPIIDRLGGKRPSSFPTVQELVSGDGYALAYARDAGGESPGLSAKGSAQFDANGRLLTYRGPAKVDLQSRTLAESGADSLIGWGRWSGSHVDNGAEVALGDNQGLHYAVGKPAPVAELKKGNASYDLAGSTAPTGSDNQPGGKLDRARLWIDFSTRRVDVDLAVRYGGHVYAVDTRPEDKSRINLNQGQATFQGQRLATTGCTSASCSTDVVGMVVGPKAERAGLAYSISDAAPAQQASATPTALATRDAASSLQINGAAVFNRTPTPSATLRD